MKQVMRLEGAPQHYDWGGRDYIAALVGIRDDRPIAEWWLGAHPSAPARVSVDGQSKALDELTAATPEALLGERVAQRFGRLPFLLKVLDVDKMLSIQVHPDKKQAEAGYAREAGRPESERNYRDDNHKPEMMVALSRFHLLHGFRSPADAILRLRAHEPFADLVQCVVRDGLQGAYAHGMSLPHEDVARRFAAIAQSLEQLPAMTDDMPEYWLQRALREGGDAGDPGLFAFFFLNLVVLEPGQAIYQGARLPHAYLHGRNIELMASSDNVLRAGLTPKRVDVAELLSVLDYTAAQPRQCAAQQVGTSTLRYRLPCEDFALDEFDFAASGTAVLDGDGPQILFVQEGSLALKVKDDWTALSAGESAFIAAGTSVQLFADAGTHAFRAWVP